MNVLKKEQHKIIGGSILKESVSKTRLLKLINKVPSVDYNPYSEVVGTISHLYSQPYFNIQSILSQLHYNVSNIKIPNSLDWRSMGAVTNIKNQKQCGSCWAFSAVGTIEGQHAIKIGNLVSLSEQNLVDCDNPSFGCEGGWPDKAIEYVINNSGIDTELSYPYVAEQQECSYSNNTIGATVSNVVRLPQADLNALYDALGTIGPISVAIDAEDDFQLYSSGIYNSSSCSTDSLDHAVLAIGYGISFNKKKYIIVKNSWGSDWGMNGYIYMSADIPNMCGIAENACYSNVTV